MAFNFNWSPLAADSSFYTRAQELLTTALNKSPKPPIIVDDILVTELNLGSIPPELEILEIGDLAEDRFRGIFKMCYSGDAFLTLKTRVQANPLNTYLSTRPAFASPQPLAAATGLTIPLQITLSDFNLSAFIILVFSKQKGLTLVFRNDPLESMKVSSTFDSIPFVRDYLQKEIEGQLRILLMDELPAIIHRLSLRLWSPEHRAREDQELLLAGSPQKEEKVVDPLASPPQDPVDSTGNVLNSSAIASLALDSGLETQSLFSQKNLIRLATLNDSNRTLSLFTPSIRDAVFRAWAGPTERGEAPGLNTPATPQMPALSRTHSHTGSTSTTYTFQDQPSGRPPLSSTSSYNSGLPAGTGRHSKAHASRKRKKRVVNLRRTNSNGDLESVSGDSIFSGSTSTSASSAFSPPPPLTEEKDDEPVTPPQSPERGVKLGKARERNDAQISPPRLVPLTPSRRPVQHSPLNSEVHNSSSRPRSLESSRHSSGLSNSQDLDATPRASRILQPPSSNPSSRQEPHPASGPSSHGHSYPPEKQASGASSHIHPEAHATPPPLPAYIESLLSSSSGSGILEQAWMMKMAGEIARRVQDEKLGSGDSPHNGFWESSHRAVGRDQYVPPPAYRQ